MLNIEICVQYQIQSILGRDMKKQTFQVRIDRIADYVHEFEVSLFKILLNSLNLMNLSLMCAE